MPLNRQYFVVLALNFLLSACASQDSGQRQRIHTLENKMDQMIHLMERETGFEFRGDAFVAKQDQNPRYDDGLILQIHILNENKPGEFPAKPAIASIVDNSPHFSYDSIRHYRPLKDYVGKKLGFLWTGYISIPKDGHYLFLNEIHHHGDADGQAYRYAIYSNMQIGDTTIPNSGQTVGHKGGSFFSDADLPLQKGRYPFRLWLAIDWRLLPAFIDGRLHPENIALKIKYRHVDDVYATTLKKNDFVHLAQFKPQ